MMDDEGIISFWNAAAVRIFGWSENEAIGTNLHSLIAPQRFHAAHNNAFPAFRVSGIGAAIGKTVELQGQRKDRSEVDIALSLSAVQLNKKWNAVGILRDITEQKRMELVRQVQYDIAHAATTIEKSENFFASIRTNLSKLINTNNFYIALYDDDTGMVSFPYFMDEEDETPEPRTMGRGLTDYVIRTGTSVFGTLEKCNELEQQGHIDIIGHPSAIWLGAPLKIGNRIFGVISVQSYTDPQCYSPADLKILEFVSNQISSAINRKQAEEQIRSQLSIIEETNKELGSARDIAIDANKAKSSFLANMSHELRTPLNAIIGYSEILIDEMGDADEKRYTSDIEKILTSGKNLLSLINDILDHSKIEAGRMELFFEEFNLQTLLKEIEDTIRPMVKSKSNTLTVVAPDESIVLRLDHTKVRQILFNLLSNSCKFSEKGNITLSAKKDQSKENFPYDVVTFTVADNGIGMTDAQMKGLFKEFSQADNSIAKTYGGTGLGLTISKRFCDMMNGSIHVKSIPSKGTTFTVTLPITFEETEKSAPEFSRTDSSATDRITFSSSTVLIIDDDPNVRDLLSRTLIKEGYAVQSADSGDDGIALARKIKPIVIILDVMMPKKDGWAVLREIKDDPELKSIPVVMHTIIDNRNLGFAVGAQDFLIKPVNPDVLVKLLDRYMQNSSAMNILIVDDDQKQRDMISRILSKGKWNVQTADNGKSAITLLSQLIPDLIILDLMMPTMDGYEFLQIIKEREEWSHIPILILTSMDLSKNDFERLSGSVADVLQKGLFDPRQLIKIVHRFSQIPLTQKSVPLE
jgi:PAS domain S-box-containing protein